MKKWLKLFTAKTLMIVSVIMFFVSCISGVVGESMPVTVFNWPRLIGAVGLPLSIILGTIGFILL